MKWVEARGSYSSSSKLIYWGWETGPFEGGKWWRRISSLFHKFMSGAMAEAMAFDEGIRELIALPYINVMGPGLACAVWAQLLKISAVFMYFVAVADYLVPLYSTRT